MPHYRPYVNGGSQTGSSLVTDGWPTSTTNVLWAGDTIQIEGSDTEYTVQSNVSSNGSGQATISISPSLSSSPADDKAVLVPAPRTFTSGMRTQIEAETAAIMYFMQFDFVLAKKITGFTNAGGGKVTVASAGHGLSSGQVTIYGTNTAYDATWTISDVTADTFNITTSYISNTSTTAGGWSADRTTYLSTAPHNMSWDSKTWQGIGGSIGFESITETTDISGHGINQILSGVDQSIVSAILSYTYFGRYARTWLAHINSSGAIVSDPKLVFWGRMNGGFEVTEQREEDRPGTVTIRGRFVDRFGELQLIRGVQSNIESHQRIFSTDTFFRHVHTLMNKKIVWGKASGGN